MPAWLPLTAEDVERAKTARLTDAARTKALASGQADPLPEIIVQVTREIRIEIASCKSNVLDEDETLLPPELISLAARRAARMLQSRINAVKTLELGDQEKEEWRQDTRRLERIAACDLAVSDPLNPAVPPIQQAATQPRISGRRKHFGRDCQDGV